LHRSARFQVYRVQQPAEALALALDFIPRHCIRLRAQPIDDDFATSRQANWVDGAAERPVGVFLTPFPVMVVKEAVNSDVTQPWYPVGAQIGEIIFLVAAAFQPPDVRIAELHFRIPATLLAMGATH